jgi:hypothetical protein
MRTRTVTDKPKASTQFAQKELDKAEAQFEKFNEDVKSMTLDRMNETPVQETEPQTKISTKEAQKKDGIWLKPVRSLSSKEKFNEAYRKTYEFAKQYVKFIAENKEIIGETINKWTKDFPGVDCEYWEVPVNTVVWGPRYLAEGIKKCKYHRLIMRDTPTNADGMGTYYGTMAVDTTVQRLDAHPVTENTSVFMGASSF